MGKWQFSTFGFRYHDLVLKQNVTVNGKDLIRANGQTIGVQRCVSSDKPRTSFTLCNLIELLKQNLPSHFRTTDMALNMITFAFTSDIKNISRHLSRFTWMHLTWEHVLLLGSYVMPSKSVSVIYKVLCPTCKHVPLFCSIVILNVGNFYADYSGKYLWTQVVEYVCFIILQIDVRN